MRRHCLDVDGQLRHFGLLGGAVGDLGLQLGHAAPRLQQLLALLARLLRLAKVINIFYFQLLKQLNY